MERPPILIGCGRPIAEGAALESGHWNVEHRLIPTLLFAVDSLPTAKRTACGGPRFCNVWSSSVSQHPQTDRGAVSAVSSRTEQAPNKKIPIPFAWDWGDGSQQGRSRDFLKAGPRQDPKFLPRKFPFSSNFLHLILGIEKHSKLHENAANQPLSHSNAIFQATY